MKKLFLITSIVLTGCASMDSDLQRESARFMSGDVAPESVELRNVERGALSVTWDAVAPAGATYRCSADDMLRRVACKERDYGDLVRGAAGVK